MAALDILGWKKEKEEKWSDRAGETDSSRPETMRRMASEN